MPDLKKVIKTFRTRIISDSEEFNTVEIPVDEAEQILALLKEQEAKSPVIREKNGYWDHVCPTCGSHDEELFHEWNYCPFCGQAVKWE